MFGHGRVAYMQIPAQDPRALATFYQTVFAWNVRGGSPHHISFTDATGDMIGAFVTELESARTPGVLPYIYVNGVDATLQRIGENGGEVVKPPYPEGDLWVATFRDPAGNILGVWQAGGR